ncbi:phage tail tape measure protein [Pseudomonas proteolytica]|uniref:phage tail tape measure protein n=1 Tax=Pseudomonas proteolytica TaxID=219574 RepID=UPI001475CF3E|nr:phage tail tape measure protein [Pseudomonas proteolytica]NMZ13316.1 phage tail tape measure protein [Pseudomonas proteolytica]
MNIAELGVKIDSADAIQAKANLDEMAKAGGRAEQSAVSLMNEMQALEKSLSTSAKTTQDLAKQRDALAKLTKTGAYGEAEAAKISAQLDKQQVALAKSAMDEQKALSSLLGAIDPARAALAKLDTQVEQLGKHLDAGRISQDQYNSALGKIDKDYAKLEKTTTGFDKLKLGTRQAQENVVQLGNALSTGDWGSGARAVAQIGVGAGASMGSMLALAAPIGLVAAAIGGLAVAYYKGSEEQDRYNKSLILTGNYAGATSSSLGGMARQVSDIVGTTGAAAAVLAQLAGSGKIVSSSFEQIAVAALSFEKATGKAASETVNDFAKLADDPVKAVVALNDKYNFLTAAVYTQIRALHEQGDTLGAQQLAESAYADALVLRADTITSNLGTVESAWDSVKGAAKGAWDAILDIGREETFDQKFEKLADRLNTLRNAQSNPMILGDNPDMMMLSRGESGAQDDITALLQKEVDDQAKARREMFQAQDMREGTKAYETLQNNLDATASKSTKLTKALEENQRRIASARQAGYTFTAAEEAALEKQTRDKFKDPKNAGTQVDLTSFNSAKNDLAAITDTYKNYQKELDAAQKAGLLSEADYLLRRQALIGNQLDQTTAAYEAEIAALEAAKGKKTTSAAQSIQLDQKIADARAGMVKAQKDADSQLEVLATNEAGRLAKQERAISSYVQALGQQQRALELAGQRAVLGAGQGDRQNALNGELNSQQDRFAQQSLDLESQRSDPSRNMSDEEFTRKSQALADANKKATDQIRQNYADVEAAQGDWTKGATSAWANYLDSAQNIAGQTKSLFGNAFSSMEDSIVNFAMTGKLSFADFTKSILADMARIATRQAASGLLGSLVGMGVSAAGSYFGGAATSAGSTAAGYSPEVLAGWSGVTQAEGGAWSGGVQMFADGGAFTNSIVSKPTAFGMANGKTGVMGEAGEEAIMPLTRTSSGKLGVLAMGGGGGGTTQINVEVHIDGDGNASSSSDDPGYDLFGKELATFVEQKYQELRTKDMRQGGVINKAIKGR